MVLGESPSNVRSHYDGRPIEWLGVAPGGPGPADPFRRDPPAGREVRGVITMFIVLPTGSVKAYSIRSARMGSPRPARRAGIQHAAVATAPKKSDPAA